MTTQSPRIRLRKVLRHSARTTTMGAKDRWATARTDTIMVSPNDFARPIDEDDGKWQ
jgi:hypothetical protein